MGQGSERGAGVLLQGRGNVGLRRRCLVDLKVSVAVEKFCAEVVLFQQVDLFEIVSPATQGGSASLE